MKKVLMAFAVLFTAVYLSACSNALSNDNVAMYVAQTAKSGSETMGGLSYSSLSALMGKMESMGVSTLADTITNTLPEGGLEIVYDMGGIIIKMRWYPITVNNNAARFRYGMSFGDTLNFDSDLSIKFYNASGEVISISTSNDYEFYSGGENASGIGMFGSITMSVKDEDGKTFSFSGNFGESIDAPFYFNNAGNVLNGKIAYTITGTDVGESITLTYNYNNLECADLASYPTGTVTGSVVQGSTTVDFSIVFNGTATAQLTVGGKNYTISLEAGTYQEV